jgi:DNA-binding NtrC family response regulator
MSMRGSSRRPAGEAVCARAFEWEPAVLATLTHCTLPWDEEAGEVSPLPEAGRAGGRDRLSLLAQFAAHQAILRFAGVSDGAFDAAEWGVIRKRGSDVRLVRLSARRCDASMAPPPITLAQEFGEHVGAGLDVLAHSWARADAVYAEAFLRLDRDAAADLRWVRRAAVGAIEAPGPEMLRSICDHPGRHAYDDPRLPAVLARFAASAPPLSVVEFRGVSPLERYSALGSCVHDRSAPPSAVAERLLGATAGRPFVFVVSETAAFDEGSRDVVAILAGTTDAVWFLPDEGIPVPSATKFVIAPRLEAAERLRSSLECDQLAGFAESPALVRYVQTGEFPEPSAKLPILAEPRRSYVAALALLGRTIERSAAERYLAGFLFQGAVEALEIEGILAVTDDELVFASEAVRDEARKLVPAASRLAISRVAAEHARGTAAALLWLDAGEPARAAEVLEQTEWSDPAQLVAELTALPAAIIPPALALRQAHALVDCGRFREARDAARGDDLVLARAERRLGDYDSALARTGKIGAGFEAGLLRAELLRLLDRPQEARAVLEALSPASAEEEVRRDFERGLLDEPVTLPEGHYLEARLATYRALENERYADAAAHAHRSIALARTTLERIDASLDRLFAIFSAGRWEDARAAGVEALREIEETEGDRAAGGIVFMLAYLAADAGQWEHAAQRIARLRHFYTTHRDGIRLAELALLTAHLDFCRGRFDEARDAALGLLDHRRGHDQIREAAALIVDEIDWIRGIDRPLRSTGNSGNVELLRRREDLLARRAGKTTDRLGDREEDVPGRLRRFRIAVACGDEQTARRLASELSLAFERSAEGTTAETQMLQAAALQEFPFEGKAFDVSWCFTSRNRLGQWSTIGSADAPPDGNRRDEDWIECSERERLYVEGSGRWSAAGREALGALFRSKAENWRLKRVLEQEDAARDTRSEAIDGIVGTSPVIREVESFVGRVARRDVPVCILGESGTGKELVARAIHRQSQRRNRLFTAVNCAALPENLIESELFGHARGAFTGADRDRPGLIETTDGGTLFLDEIGELPLPAQAKVLRFLQEGEFRRVGEATNRNADVRIVSATNRKLAAAVEEGRFREDLYYRISVVEIPLPPLRERGGDVLLLAIHFLDAERAKHRGGPVSLSPDVEAVLTSYPWPGNVRELQNAIRGAHAMAGDSRQIELEHLPERMRRITPSKRPAGSYHEAVARFRRELIERSLAEARGNQNRAAAALRMSRQALAYQIRELGILVRV